MRTRTSRRGRRASMGVYTRKTDGRSKSQETRSTAAQARSSAARWGARRHPPLRCSRRHLRAAQWCHLPQGRRRFRTRPEPDEQHPQGRHRHSAERLECGSIRREPPTRDDAPRMHRDGSERTSLVPHAASRESGRLPPRVPIRGPIGDRGLRRQSAGS